MPDRAGWGAFTGFITRRLIDASTFSWVLSGTAVSARVRLGKIALALAWKAILLFGAFSLGVGGRMDYVTGEDPAGMEVHEVSGDFVIVEYEIMKERQLGKDFVVNASVPGNLVHVGHDLGPMNQEVVG